MDTSKFPKDFFWGAATSSHQVEGGNRNDWSEWEQAHAKRLTAEAKKRQWPDFILENYPNPLQEENYISGRACDHYHRFREDFDIAKQLNHNAHRFSIEWSRVEPEEGRFDEREIEHYREVIRALRERGMEPFVTLWHWTLPLWVRDMGGWENKKTIDDFTRYVNKIVRSVKDIKFWIVLNEPEICTMNSYLRGAWPPKKKSLFKFVRVMRNLVEAHNRAYEVIHSDILENVGMSVEVGIAKNNSYFEGWAAPILNYLWNHWFLDQVANHQDFIGLNYYFHNRIKGFRYNQNENKEVSDMGWEIYPEGIYHVLKDLKKYSKPIYVTENGVADIKDVHREKFIKEHLRWLDKAILDGADVRGYFYWSLLDNFEWDKGFLPRFGLIEVDYKTMERRIRPSARAYKEIIEKLWRQTL